MPRQNNLSVLICPENRLSRAPSVDRSNRSIVNSLLRKDEGIRVLMKAECGAFDVHCERCSMQCPPSYNQLIRYCYSKQCLWGLGAMLRVVFLIDFRTCLLSAIYLVYTYPIGTYINCLLLGLPVCASMCMLCCSLCLCAEILRAATHIRDIAGLRLPRRYAYEMGVGRQRVTEVQRASERTRMYMQAQRDYKTTKPGQTPFDFPQPPERTRRRYAGSF